MGDGADMVEWFMEAEQHLHDTQQCGDYCSLCREEEMDAAIAKELKGLKKQWKQAKPAQPGFVPLDDGKTTGKLVSMKVGKSNNNRLQMVWTFECLEGTNKGKTAKIFDGLEDATNMSYFKGRCEIVGFEVPDDPTELQDAADAFVEENEDLFTLDIRTKGDYQNIYIAGVSELEEGEGDEDEEEDESDEDEVDEDEDEENEDEDEDEEEDEEEEEEVEEPPKKKSKSSAKGGKGKGKGKAATKTTQKAKKKKGRR